MATADPYRADASVREGQAPAGDFDGDVADGAAVGAVLGHGAASLRASGSLSKKLEVKRQSGTHSVGLDNRIDPERGSVHVKLHQMPVVGLLTLLVDSVGRDWRIDYRP